MAENKRGEIEKGNDLTITVGADVDEAVSGFKRLQRELRKTTQEAREMERAVNSDKIARVNEVRDVQGEPGNWDVSDYMTGLYNGLELASALLEEREPEYRECKPDDAFSTRVLCEELSKRAGVKEYDIAPHGERAIIKFYDENGNVSNVDVDGPARLLVNVD